MFSNLKSSDVYRFARDVITLSARQNLGLIAAGVAFFSMLSLFPAMAALIAVFGLFLDPSVALEQTAALKSIIPAEAYGIIADQMRALISARTPTLGVTGVVSISIAIWTARMGVGALMQGLNAICEVEDRGSIRHYFSSIVLTLLLICVALVALSAVVVTPIFIALIPPGADAESVFSLSFSISLSRFGNYNETYGSIGAVAALMMWFYISAYLVLFGAAWNVTLRSLRT